MADDADRAEFRARLGTLADAAGHLGVSTSGIAKGLAGTESVHDLATGITYSVAGQARA